MLPKLSSIPYASWLHACSRLRGVASVAILLACHCLQPADLTTKDRLRLADCRNRDRRAAD